MRKEFGTKLNGDESRKDASASFTLPFDTRDVWGKAKVHVKVTNQWLHLAQHCRKQGRGSVHRRQLGRPTRCRRKGG